MKRSDIRNAYDSMGPTPEQRDRMYNAIMKASGKQNGRYQAQPTKQRKWAWIPAAAAVIFIAVMGVFVLGRGGNEDITLSSDATNPVETETIPPAHHALLDVYRTAIQEGWTEEQCQEYGISVRFADTEYARENAAYVLLDIDGNGIQELIIGHGMPHYFYVWDLYAFENYNGEAVQLHTDVKDHANCHLYDNGIIGTEFTGKTEGAYSYFRLNGATLFSEAILTYRDDFWYDEINKQQVSQEEANEILNKYEMLDVEPVDLMDATNYDHEDIEAVEQYSIILEKYRTALAEHWDPGKCIENGISLMVGYYGGIVTQLGHNQMDLNGDGSDELIITDGTNIYDLYTIINDEEVGPLRLIDATERSQYFLTTDGYIYNMASGSAMLSYYYLFNVGQKELVFKKGLKFDASVDPNNPWSYYEGSMDKAVDCSAEEAAAIIDAVHFADISFIPFNVRIVQGEPVVTQLPLEALEVLAAMPQGSYGYAEHIAWLIPWREAEFDNPPPLYYCLHDWNEDGIIDMILGYEDSVLSVWSYMYDKNSKTEHLTLLTLSDEEYTELDKAWLKMDIRNITEFELN